MSYRYLRDLRDLSLFRFVFHLEIWSGLCTLDPPTESIYISGYTSVITPSMAQRALPSALFAALLHAMIRYFCL